jgi:hypothetical protein
MSGCVQEVGQCAMALNEAVTSYQPRITGQGLGDLWMLDNKLVERLIACGGQAARAAFSKVMLVLPC